MSAGSFSRVAKSRFSVVHPYTFPLIMSSSRKLLVLTHDYRHVAVFRDQCGTYEVSRCVTCSFFPWGLIAMMAHLAGRAFLRIRSTFPAARGTLDEDIVVKAIFSGEPGRLVELSKEVWETAFPRVIDVTITIVESKNSME